MTCKDCYFYGRCDGASVCPSFTSLILDSLDDKAIDETIECGRTEYRLAWNSYINEF